jgi:hypothetical protein
MGHGARPEREG